MLVRQNGNRKIYHGNLGIQERLFNSILEGRNIHCCALCPLNMLNYNFHNFLSFVLFGRAESWTPSYLKVAYYLFIELQKSHSTKGTHFSLLWTLNSEKTGLPQVVLAITWTTAISSTFPISTLNPSEEHMESLL